MSGYRTEPVIKKQVRVYVHLRLLLLGFHEYTNSLLFIIGVLYTHALMALIPNGQNVRTFYEAAILPVHTINEPAAAGAYEALKSIGRENDVLIVSVDGGCPGVQNVSSCKG